MKRKRGRPKKLSTDEETELVDLYRYSELNITQLAKLFRVSGPTAGKIIDREFKKGKAADDERDCDRI